MDGATKAIHLLCWSQTTSYLLGLACDFVEVTKAKLGELIGSSKRLKKSPTFFTLASLRVAIKSCQSPT